MENNKGKFRLFGLINPVDVIIAAAAVTFLSWAFLVFSEPTSVDARASDVKVRYTVELAERESGAYLRVVTGTAVFDSLRGFAIGTVVDAYALPYREDAPDLENKLIRRAPVDGMEFTYVVIEATATITDYATSIGNYDVLVNTEVFIYSKFFAGYGYVTSLERLG